MIIKVANPKTDKFGDSIRVLLDILLRIFPLPLHEEIIIDFSGCHFSNPFILLSLTILQAECSKVGRTLIFKRASNSSIFESYLNYINFHEGFKPDSMSITDYTERMKVYEPKNYIPIINFPARRSVTETTIRDSFLSVINHHLTNKLGLSGQLRNGIFYLLDEAVNNIVDHSQSDRGYIFAQYYPTKEFMDITIADNGIGLLGSYQNSNNPEILTDTDAIKSALNGISTKTTEDGRGYGIRTSRKMLVEGLGGKYLLFSGSGVHINIPNQEAIIELKDRFRMSGTIVFMRIPMQNHLEFQYSRYLEG